MASARISVRELARQVGVSPASVSRVLNDKPGVSESVRARVLDGVRVYGLPGQAVGNTGGSPFVGIIVPELDNPAFPTMAAHIENALFQHGITGLIGSSVAQGGVDEREYIEVLLRHGARGLVLVSGWHAHLKHDHRWYRQLTAREVSVVFVSGLVEGLPMPSVGTSEASGARIAIRFLHDLGHRRIGLAQGEEHYRPSVNRLRGYRETMGRYGLADQSLYAEAVYTMDGGHVAARRLIGQGATAIITGSDVMAVGVIKAAQEMGLRVPEDLSVVGYDDGPLAVYGHPRLTTVRQPVDRIAAATAWTMDQLLKGQEPPQLHQRFDPTLIVRDSTAQVRQDS